MKNRLFALMLALAFMLSMLTGCGSAKTDTSVKADASAAASDAGTATADEGKISSTIILVLEDESEVEYNISYTEGASLRDALFEAGLISEETFYAMFVEDIDGHVANVAEDGCTWVPYDTDGNQIMSVFEEIFPEADQTIRLVYTVVPDMD